MHPTVRGLIVRPGIVYAALVVAMHPAILGPLGVLLHAILGTLARPFGVAVGLGHYPLQGEMLFRIVVVLVAGVVWTRVDQRRHVHPSMQELITVLRFALAAGMISYGVGHFFGIITPWPSQAEWIRPIREMEAQHYINVWIGASSLHKVSLGISELAAGVFLLARRTTTLGAFLSVAVLGNEVMTQVGFGDVRVGRYWMSAELAAMATVLLFADRRRLIDAIAFDERTVPPPALSHPTRGKGARLASGIAVALIVLVNIPAILLGIDALHRSAIAGVYRVEEFTVGGQPVPVERGESRWRMVAIDDCERFAVRTIGERQLEGAVVLDGAGTFTRRRKCARVTSAGEGAISLAPLDSAPPLIDGRSLVGSLHWVRSTDGGLQVEGEVTGSRVSARLRRLPDSLFRVFAYRTESGI